MPQMQHRGAGGGAQKPKPRMLGADAEFAVFETPANEALIESTKTLQTISVESEIACANTLPSVESCSGPGASKPIEESSDQWSDLVQLPLPPKSPECLSRQRVKRQPAGKRILRELLRHEDATATSESPCLCT